MISETKSKYQRKEVEPIIESIYEELKPHCKQIEIVGSNRRKRSEVKDIEFVVIPKTEVIKDSLFEAHTVRTDGFINSVVAIGRRIKGDVETGKLMVRLHFTGIHVEIYTANFNNFGYIVMLRTGPWEFGKQMFGIEIRKRGYYCKDGYIYRSKDNERMDTPTEESVFKLLKTDYIMPELRQKGMII